MDGKYKNNIKKKYYTGFDKSEEPASMPAYTDFLVETSDYYSVREQSVGVTSVGYDGHTAVRHCTAQSSPVASQSVSQSAEQCWGGHHTRPHQETGGERPTWSPGHQPGLESSPSDRQSTSTCVLSVQSSPVM